MKNYQSGILVVLATTALMSVVAHIRADDKRDTVVEKRIRIVAQAGGKYWIGVHAVPVGAALKSHLGIEDRLVVQHVIDDSPAAKAGVQQHDVILKYGDASITTVEELIKAVGEGEDKEKSLALIRGGKKMSLKVTPAERPEGQQAIPFDASEIADLPGVIGDWVHRFSFDDPEGGSPLRFHIVGPGVVGHGHDITTLHKGLSGKMPKNLSIQINKSGDKPAKIKVTRDGETWEVTEDSLDKLPEDIRPHIMRSLGKQTGVVFGFAPDGQQTMRLKALQIHPGKNANQVVPRVVLPKAATRTLEALRRVTDDGEIDELRQDLEDLKAVVKKLQEGKRKKEKKDDN